MRFSFVAQLLLKALKPLLNRQFLGLSLREQACLFGKPITKLTFDLLCGLMSLSQRPASCLKSLSSRFLALYAPLLFPGERGLKLL